MSQLHGAPGGNPEPDLEFVIDPASGKTEADIERALQEAIDAVNEGMSDILEAFGMGPITLETLFTED